MGSTSIYSWWPLTQRNRRPVAHEYASVSLEMEQATKETALLVWNDMVSNDRMRRYYDYMVARHKRSNRILRWIAAVLSSGAVVAFLFREDLGFLVSVAFVVAAGLNIWLAESKTTDSVAYCLDIYRQLDRLSVEWKDLWADVYQESDSVVRERWKDLASRTSTAIADAPSKVGYVEKLATRSQEESYEYWRAVHAQA